MNILDQYIRGNSHPQNLVDIFKGEWSSKLPAVNGIAIDSGNADLFNDNRMILLNNTVNVSGKKILELGPLEAGHTYMLHHLGASAISAVESNTRAFLKCLLVKELYGLSSVEFLLGDALTFITETKEKYDIAVASGILYHSTDPGKMLKELCHISDHVFIWTHFYENAAEDNFPALTGKFSEQKELAIDGYQYTVKQFNYLQSLEWAGFCGGLEPYSLWMEKKDIIGILNKYGLTEMSIFFEDRTHPFGPNICLMASRTK